MKIETKHQAQREIERLTDAIQGDAITTDDPTWEDVGILAQHAQDLEAACVAWQEIDQRIQAPKKRRARS